MTTRKESSTNRLNEKYIVEGSDLSYAVCKLGGRWKLIILEKLEGGKLRFSALRQTMPLITERMLTRQLRELEQDGVVTRTVYAEVPPRVEYALSARGRELIPIWKQLSEWGSRHRTEVPAH